jgi:hypothetical protein
VKVKLFFLLALATLCLAAAPALAGTLKAYNYPEISLEAPAAINVKKWDFRDELPTAGCCYLGAKQLSIMVLINKFPDQNSLQNSLVKLSGVPLNSWTLTAQASKDARGWTWRKEYQTVVNGQAVRAVLGHGEKAAYLLVLCADKNDPAWPLIVRVSSSRSKPR